MSWDNAARWDALCDGSACPICVRGEPRDVLVELKATWVTGGEEAPLPGYVCVVSKRHVVEPFQLSATERVTFWEEAMEVSQAIADRLRPIKMNYEIHGNTIPHLHLHLFPRTQGDPYVGGPIDPRVASFRRTSEELDRIARAITVAIKG